MREARRADRDPATQLHAGHHGARRTRGMALGAREGRRAPPNGSQLLLPQAARGPEDVKTVVIRGTVDGRLAAELTRFESQFRYPLGSGWFRIDHGDDYLRFYRSLGDAFLVVAEDDSGVVGACCAAVRTVRSRGHD